MGSEREDAREEERNELASALDGREPYGTRDCFGGREEGGDEDDGYGDDGKRDADDADDADDAEGEKDENTFAFIWCSLGDMKVVWPGIHMY